jgi:hypothetical protein
VSLRRAKWQVGWPQNQRFLNRCGHAAAAQFYNSPMFRGSLVPRPSTFCRSRMSRPIDQFGRMSSRLTASAARTWAARTRSLMSLSRAAYPPPPFVPDQVEATFSTANATIGQRKVRPRMLILI